MSDQAFLTTDEVQRYLQVNLRTVYRLIKAGEIPAIRVGRQWRFRRSDIDAWLAGARPPAAAPAVPADPLGEAAAASHRIPPEAPSRSPAPATSPATAPAAAPAGRRARILVADDEASVREVIDRTLALADYVVVDAEDGQQAIARLRRERFDLLITDLRMPGADGLTVIREARRLYPDLPVVIITGYSSEASAIEAINLGVNGYLTKPFRVPKVLSVVSRALGE